MQLIWFILQKSGAFQMRVKIAFICLAGLAATTQVAIPGAKWPDINPVDVIFPQLAALRETARVTGNQEFISASQNFEAIGSKIETETRASITKALTRPEQAVQDAVQAHIKAANEIIDAAHATARYAERYVESYGKTLSDSAQKASQGKVVDAIWELQINQLRNENNNSAKLMQESALIKQAAQSAAGFYGGPAGSAAFTAWWVYNNSDRDVDAALKAGAYAYVVNAGLADTGSMPSGTVGEVAKKAAATAAVKGLAVAAAGGGRENIIDAAIQGGGSVLIQSGQSYVSKTYVDPTKAKLQSEADQFCMNALNASCSDAHDWLDAKRARLEEYKAKADQIANTVAIGDGSWTVSWDRKSLLTKGNKSPSVVLTYVGEGSPFRAEILELASIGDPLKFTPPFATWVALRDPGAADFYFSEITPGSANLSSLKFGDILFSLRDVNVRSGAFGGGWKEPTDIVRGGDLIKVLEARIADTSIGPQEWIRFEHYVPSGTLTINGSTK